MRRGKSSRLGLVLLALAAFAVVAKALAYLAGTPQTYGFEEQAPVYHAHRAWLLVHIVCGVLALTSGTTQLIVLRMRAPDLLHRWTGRVYALAVLGGGVSGLPMAAIAWGGIANKVAFGLLAVLWMFTTGQAAWGIWQGQLAQHRVWIARSFALTLAAVTLRAEVGLLQLAGLSFADAYHIAAWTCWVLNLLVVEWFRTRTPEPLSARAAAAAS